MGYNAYTILGQSYCGLYYVIDLVIIVSLSPWNDINQLLLINITNYKEFDCIYHVCGKTVYASIWN